MHFADPPGDCHIKYGYIGEDEHFVVKVATGFYENALKGLPSGNGLMLVFSQKTGGLEAILLDQGYLTDLRTAVAGLIVAKYLAPKNVHKIGVVGTGVQARMQVELLTQLTSCRQLIVWGRSKENASLYASDMKSKGFEVEVASTVAQLCAQSNLIITTTASRQPLIQAEFIRPGTHITAVGADGPGKQEIAANVFAMADRCIVDSISQCTVHGDVSFAFKSGSIRREQLVELGELTMNTNACSRRAEEKEVTIADLTGLVVQDLKIATLVLQSWRKSQE